MALPATTVVEVQTGGSDTLNGATFSTASTGKPTDLTTDANTANTASPVVSSALYNFVAGDVSHWVYIQAGTDWIPGWYQIVSVASNKATLNAAIGAAVLANGTLNTAVGCASVGTPTGGTWAVDYSQSAAVAFSLTGLTTAAADAIILTASATKAMVGSGIVITGGTNFTVGYYSVIAAAAGVSLTVDRNCTTAAGALGTAGIGGALASPGKACSLIVAGSRLYQKSGTYTLTSASTNIAGGVPSLNVASASATAVFYWEGFNVTRGDLGTPPVISAGAITGIGVVTIGGNWNIIHNIKVDGNNGSSNFGFNGAGVVTCRNCIAVNCPARGYTVSFAILIGCLASSCTIGFNLTGRATSCVAASGTGIGFSVTADSSVSGCISYSNSGASSDGFQFGGNTITLNECTAYGNGRSGFLRNSTGQNQLISNCLSVGNSAYGFNINNGSTIQNIAMLNCAGYNNTSGNVNGSSMRVALGFITLTADPFANAAGGNFALNATAGGGAACRAAGYPGLFPGGLSTGYLDIGAVQSGPSARGFAAMV